jgi:hypothetical protein
MRFLCSKTWRAEDPEAEFLDEIQTKVLRVFLLAIHSHLYDVALRFIWKIYFSSPLSHQT